ncbi:hypothetical protein F383_11687 [Gossypium arboreum]|uniref:Uncharacterized protein n=1 Tax=Gossypium arboreum TaxID=29729 RepID=A0A0B0Q036_GOSAR|nr:hypothetical protein F383_11687 [Gossypium arboreum]
MPLSQTGS